MKTAEDYKSYVGKQVRVEIDGNKREFKLERIDDEKEPVDVKDLKLRNQPFSLILTGPADEPPVEGTASIYFPGEADPHELYIKSFHKGDTTIFYEVIFN